MAYILTMYALPIAEINHSQRERERDRPQCHFIDFGIYSFTNIYLKINGRHCTVVTDHTPSSFQPY